MRSQTVVPLALQIISHLQREQYAVPLVELRQVLYSSAVLQLQGETIALTPLSPVPAPHNVRDNQCRDYT